MLEEDIIMSVSVPISLFLHLFHKGANSMSKKNLFFLIGLLFLLTAVRAKATYTDYIGAGHDEGVTADASSFDYDSPTVGAFPQNTVNGTGISGNTHSTLWEDTWTSLAGTTAPSPNPARGTGHWLHYDLGQVYQLALMHVWNDNEEGQTDRGFNSVTIDYSVNGSTWIELETDNWPEASGSGSYTGFDASDFGTRLFPTRPRGPRPRPLPAHIQSR